MAFQRHRAFGAEQLHQFGGQDDHVDVILLGMLGALEDLGEAAAQRLDPVHVVAGHDCARSRAHDDQHFVRNRFHHRAQRTASDSETAKHHDNQNYETNSGEHCLTP